MALYTLAEAQENYSAAKTAYRAALGSQSYSIGPRSLSRQQLRDLKDEMDYWANAVRNYGKSRHRTRYVVNS